MPLGYYVQLAIYVLALTQLTRILTVFGASASSPARRHATPCLSRRSQANRLRGPSHPACTQEQKALPGNYNIQFTLATRYHNKINESAKKVHTR